MNEQVTLAVPDLVSPSYFPAIAAIELGYAREEGLDAKLELIYPVTKAADALRDGQIDFLAGAAHAPMHAFPGWDGAKLLAALSQHTYWFLVMRRDLGIARGDLQALENVRIGAAPGVDLALRTMFEDAGVDLTERGITIGPVPGTAGAGVSFGVTAAEALAAGEIDGFWANGMGAEVALRQGVGSLIIDARRGDGPAPLPGYTFPALATTDKLLAQRPHVASAMTRALLRAQHALRENPDLATEAARGLFPEMETSLIAELVRRDAVFYDPAISPESVTSLIDFGRRHGLVGPPAASTPAAVVAPTSGSEPLPSAGGRG